MGSNEKVTTLQLAQYASTLASKGKRMKPQFVDRVQTYDGQTMYELEPVVLDEISFQPEYWRVVTEGMAKVYVRGFEGFPYPFARKTGTSTQSVGGKLIDNAVFIAYAPLDKPKLAVAVVVPEGGFGAWNAAPIARKVFDAYDEVVGLGGPAKRSKDDLMAVR